MLTTSNNNNNAKALLNPNNNSTQLSWAEITKLARDTTNQRQDAASNQFDKNQVSI